FFFSSRRRHTRFSRDWSSDVCSSDLAICSKRGSLRPNARFLCVQALRVLSKLRMWATLKPHQAVQALWLPSAQHGALNSTTRRRETGLEKVERLRYPNAYHLHSAPGIDQVDQLQATSDRKFESKHEA